MTRKSVTLEYTALFCTACTKLGFMCVHHSAIHKVDLAQYVLIEHDRNVSSSPGQVMKWLTEDSLLQKKRATSGAGERT